MRKHLQLLGFGGQIMFFINIAVVGIMFDDQKVLEFRHIKKTMLPFKVRSVWACRGRLHATCGTS
jgi:hypothetical protein